MPLEAETHAVHSGMTMPPLAEKACRRSGICRIGVLFKRNLQNQRSVLLKLITSLYEDKIGDVL